MIWGPVDKSHLKQLLATYCAQMVPYIFDIICVLINDYCNIVKMHIFGSMCGVVFSPGGQCME